MVIFKENQTLDEMAMVCKKSDGYGIIIQIFSNDHGKIGNERQPAHAHLFDTNMNPLGEFVLTPDAPRNSQDVIWYRSKDPQEGYAAKIVKWSRGLTEHKFNNWAFALDVWKMYH